MIVDSIQNIMISTEDSSNFSGENDSGTPQ